MFQMSYIFAKLCEGEIPDIYLQDHNYFKKYEKQLREYYGNGIVKSDYVSLHIRRGDYVNNPVYVDLTTTAYYDKAIAEFPNDKFLIFCADRQDNDKDSTDRIWCTRYLRELGLTDRFEWFFAGVLKDSEIEDFNAMAGCKAHIMANSSFSWWASYVGGGKTIAPLEWFTDKINRVTLLDEWQKF